MQGLGFDEIATTEAFQICDFFFFAALRLLLFGNGRATALDLGVNNFRRHTAKTKFTTSRRRFWQTIRCEKLTGNVHGSTWACKFALWIWGSTLAARRLIEFGVLWQLVSRMLGGRCRAGPCQHWRRCRLCWQT